MSDAAPLISDHPADGTTRATLPAPPRPLLDVQHLSKHYALRRGALGLRREMVAAVDDVSFTLARGETLGLVGESGSGKSTIARAVLRLLPGVRGAVRFDGRDLYTLRPGELRRTRRHMQMIFQDPVGSLNGRMRVGQIVGEPLLVHGLARGRALRERVAETLQRCGLPADAAGRYPHAFSGGQRQRIGIARAVMLRPKLIVCDEPTSALDVSVQAQILNLLRDLQDELGLSYLFISHDMAVVEHMADRIAVLHRGRIVEQGPRERVLHDPQHAYTRRLLAAAPSRR